MIFLNALGSIVEHKIHEKAFWLISAMTSVEGRNLAAQLLFKSLENPEKVKLNDNLLLNEDYKALFKSGNYLMELI